MSENLPPLIPPGSCSIPPSGDAAWGSITGILADQTDLQQALDGKSPIGHTHSNAEVNASIAADPAATRDALELEVLTEDSLPTQLFAYTALPLAISSGSHQFEMSWDGNTEQIYPTMDTGNTKNQNAVALASAMLAITAITDDWDIYPPKTSDAEDHEVYMVHKTSQTVTAFNFTAVIATTSSGYQWEDIGVTAVYDGQELHVGFGSIDIYVALSSGAPTIWKKIGADLELNPVLSLLGIPSFADRLTANAALAEINRTYYDQALSRINQTDATS